MNKNIDLKRINKKWIFLFLIPILFLTINILSCNSQTENKDKSTSEKLKEVDNFKIEHDSLEKVIDAIIDISANDFYKNQNPLPIDFHNVEIKYHLKPNKEMLYILCGQFQTDNTNERTQFATIKNSDYEQWIGPNGSTYCENSIGIPYSAKELSTELKSRLNSLIETKK